MNSSGVAFISLIAGAALGAGALYQKVLKPEEDQAAAQMEVLQGEVRQAQEALRVAQESARQGTEKPSAPVQEINASAVAEAMKRTDALARELAEEKKKEEALASQLAELQGSKSSASGVNSAPAGTAMAPASPAPGTDAPKGPTLADFKRDLAAAQDALADAKRRRAEWEASLKQEGHSKDSGTPPDEFSSRRINELQATVDNLQFKVDTFGL